MVIDYNGGRLVVKPACADDLPELGMEGSKERLFVDFVQKTTGPTLRRAYTSQKPPAEGERPFFVKLGGGYVEVSKLEDPVWCDADGRRFA